jgi:hypothetical protein
MTSEIGVEQPVEPHFLFHCSCGEVIQTSAKREVCSACGETIEVVRCVPTPNGNKYTLRISKHRKRVNAEPRLWPQALQPKTTTHRTRRRHVVRGQEGGAASTQPVLHCQLPDYNGHYIRVGLLILLSPLWVPLLLIVLSRLYFAVPVQQNGSNLPIIEMPEPTDCGWFSGCHYEREGVRVNDRSGGYLVVSWRRVND